MDGVTVTVTVTDCLAAFGDAARMTSSALAGFLSEKAGATVTQNKLARMLRPFGIQPTTARVGGKLAKAYMRPAFEGQTVTPAQTVTPPPAATVTPPARTYTDDQVDRAVAGAWAHFHAMNDINNPEAWA